jgi:hypothetical protein
MTRITDPVTHFAHGPRRYSIPTSPLSTRCRLGARPSVPSLPELASPLEAGAHEGLPRVAGELFGGGVGSTYGALIWAAMAALPRGTGIGTAAMRARV